MLFRMVSTHPPIDVMRMVSAGRIAWTSTFEMNVQSNAGCSVLS